MGLPRHMVFLIPVYGLVFVVICNVLAQIAVAKRRKTLMKERGRIGLEDFTSAIGSDREIRNDIAAAVRSTVAEYCGVGDDYIYPTDGGDFLGRLLGPVDNFDALELLNAIRLKLQKDPFDETDDTVVQEINNIKTVGDLVVLVQQKQCQEQ